MFKLFISTLAITLLVGCAATPATIVSSARASVQNNPEHGAVALRLTISAPEVGTFFEFWDSITVSSLDPGKTENRYEVALSNLGAIGSASYFGALPPGKYRFERLDSKTCGMMCLSSGVTFKEKAPTFEVSKGQISYLGNVIYVRERDRTGLFFHPVSDRDNFRQWLKTYYAGWADAPLREADGTNPHKGEMLYAAVQNLTMGYLNGVATPNGTVLFNNFAGSLQKLTWPATISTVNTGLLSRGNTVLPLSDDRWLVGGDFAEVRETHNGGATWSDAKLNLPYGAVRGLYRGKGEELLVFLQQQQELEMYSGPIGGPWVRLSSVPFKRNIHMGGITRPVIIPSDDRKRLLVAIPSGKSFVFDTSTYARSEFEYPGGPMSVGLSGDDVLRCSCNRSGFWVSTWESRDGGKSWQDSELKRTMPLPHFTDKLTAFGTNQYSLARTLDGGKTWTDTLVETQRPYWPHLMLPYEVRYIPAGKKRLVATDTFFKLLASEDDGATWQTVPYLK